MRSSALRCLLSALVVGIILGGCADDGARGDANPSGKVTTTAGATGAGLSTAKVGVILPETGALAAQSIQIQHGIEVATAIWNEHGGPQLSLDYCDEGATPDQAIACVDKLKADGVDLYSGPQFGTSWVSTQQTYVDGGQFAVTGTPAAQPPASSNIFSSGSPASVGLSTAFDEFKKSHRTNVGFLSSSDGSAQAAAKAADGVAAKYGLRLTKAEFDVSGPATSQAQTVVSSNPDVVVAWSTGPGVVTALRGLQSAAYDGPVVLNPSNATAATYKLAADVLPKQLSIIGSPALVRGGVREPVRKRFLDEFTARYEAKYGTISWIGLGGADIVILLGTAAAHGSTPADMTAYLEGGAEVPALTTPLTFSATSHVGSTSPDDLRLVRLVGTKWEFAHS